MCPKNIIESHTNIGRRNVTAQNHIDINLMMIKAGEITGFVYFWIHIVAYNEISIVNFSKAERNNQM